MKQQVRTEHNGYRSTITKECIAVSPSKNANAIYFVEMMKRGDTPEFAVYISYDDKGYMWRFDGDTPSDYERVKMCVFDVIFEWDTIPEMIESLDAVFNNDFEDILLDDDDDEWEDEDDGWAECDEDEDEDDDWDEEDRGCCPRCPFNCKS